jgi:hypothetical protein
VPIDQEGTVQARGLLQTREASFALSPGDVDEIVQSFLVFGDPVEANEAVRGTSFERMEAFRLGFFQDEATCEQLTSRRADRAGVPVTPRRGRAGDGKHPHPRLSRRAS